MAPDEAIYVWVISNASYVNQLMNQNGHSRGARAATETSNSELWREVTASSVDNQSGRAVGNGLAVLINSAGDTGNCGELRVKRPNRKQAFFQDLTDGRTDGLIATQEPLGRVVELIRQPAQIGTDLIKVFPALRERMNDKRF